MFILRQIVRYLRDRKHVYSSKRIRNASTMPLKSTYPLFLAFIILIVGKMTFGEDSPQIKDLGGSVLIDSSVQVTGVVQVNRWFELVEVSTPSTPSTNHVRIWANSTDGRLKAIFDNGTVVTIAVP